MKATAPLHHRDDRCHTSRHNDEVAEVEFPQPSEAEDVFRATAARIRVFRAFSLTLSPSWMSMARLTFPSRLELNRPEGSSSAAPLANVILTTFLYVSPVQTMPPWDQTGVPGFVGFTHFHSSTILGSASCMISRTFASVFPRQSPSCLIFSSINAEADSTGMSLLMYTSNSRTNLAEFTLSPFAALRAVRSGKANGLSVTWNLRKWKALHHL